MNPRFSLSDDTRRSRLSAGELRGLHGSSAATCDMLATGREPSTAKRQSPDARRYRISNGQQTPRRQPAAAAAMRCKPSV